MFNELYLPILDMLINLSLQEKYIFHLSTSGSSICLFISISKPGYPYKCYAYKINTFFLNLQPASKKKDCCTTPPTLTASHRYSPRLSFDIESIVRIEYGVPFPNRCKTSPVLSLTFMKKC